MESREILDRIRGDPISECWLWLGAHTSGGYGSVTYEGRNWLVHRWVYTHAKGPIPEGWQIDHTCRDRGCCNPDHLEAVSGSVNCARRDDYKRALRNRQRLMKGRRWRRS